VTAVRNVLTYTTTHKEELNTSALDRESSPGVRREKLTKEGGTEEDRQGVKVKPRSAKRRRM